MRRAEGLEPLSEAAAAELGDLAERVVVTTRILRDFEKAWGFGRFARRRRAADQPWWRRACAACCPPPTETPEEMLDRIVRFKVRRRRFCACGKTVFGSCLPPPLLSPFLRVGANHRSSSSPLRFEVRRDVKQACAWDDELSQLSKATQEMRLIELARFEHVSDLRSRIFHSSRV